MAVAFSGDLPAAAVDWTRKLAEENSAVNRLNAEENKIHAEMQLLRQKLNDVNAQSLLIDSATFDMLQGWQELYQAGVALETQPVPDLTLEVEANLARVTDVRKNHSAVLERLNIVKNQLSAVNKIEVRKREQEKLLLELHGKFLKLDELRSSLCEIAQTYHSVEEEREREAMRMLDTMDALDSSAHSMVIDTDASTMISVDPMKRRKLEQPLFQPKVAFIAA